jgi:hypothetical protein
VLRTGKGAVDYSREQHTVLVAMLEVCRHRGLTLRETKVAERQEVYCFLYRRFGGCATEGYLCAGNWNESKGWRDENEKEDLSSGLSLCGNGRECLSQEQDKRLDDQQCHQRGRGEPMSANAGANYPPHTPDHQETPYRNFTNTLISPAPPEV